MTFPVSIKGVVVHANKVLLLKNTRDEWELPGGRLELGETPEECVAREIEEETGWRVEVGPILDTWLYHVEIVNRHRLHRHLRLPPDGHTRDRDLAGTHHGRHVQRRRPAGTEPPERLPPLDKNVVQPPRTLT